MQNTVPLTDQYETLRDQDINIENQEQLAKLDKFISELNEFDKALILMYLDDRSHVEIGDVLGLFTTNVGTKIQRIKDKLKKKFH